MHEVEQQRQKWECAGNTLEGNLFLLMHTKKKIGIIAMSSFSLLRYPWYPE